MKTYLKKPFIIKNKSFSTVEDLHDFIITAEVFYFANLPKGISIKNTEERMSKLRELKKDIDCAKKYFFQEIKNN